MQPGKRKRAFSVFAGRVERGGARQDADFLAGLFRIDAARAVFATHRFHPYAARMPPSIARAAIARYGPETCARAAPGRSAWSLRAGAGQPVPWQVYDPFCGSGTVLVEAMLAGMRAGGSDASPLSVELARVRTTPLSPARRARMVALAEAVAMASAAQAMQRARLTALPDWAGLEREHFEPHVLLELLGLRACLQAVPNEDPEIARALWLCLSSCLLKWSREATPQHPSRAAQAGPGGAEARETWRGPDRRTRGMTVAAPVPVMRRIGRGVPSRFFARRVRELGTALAELERAAPSTEPVSIDLADARTLPHVSDESVALCVTSPPYAGVYDYARLHETRYRFLGLDQRSFLDMQIGAPAGRGAHRRAFTRDRDAFMAAIARVLMPGGRALLMVGDGVLDGQPENAREAIAEAGIRAGLRMLAYASQTRPPRTADLRAIFARTPRHEHILLLDKPR